MKANKLNALTLSTVVLAAVTGGASISSGDDQIQAEVLPDVTTVTCCDPIVVYRKVYLNEPLPVLGARLYDKVDYELKIRGLTRDINVAEAELAIQRDRQRVYDRYFSRTSALYVTRQNVELEIVKQEQQLKLLRQEKLLALRYRNDQVRYRELLLAEGAARLFLDK